MNADALKRAAAERAAALVDDGMRLGLGTGSTAKHFVALLGERVRAGLRVVGVPTSEATRAQAEAEGIALTTLDETPALDLTVDGADELDDELRLIKGGGGALLREKIVAAASSRMIVIADTTKRVETLGRFPLPVEVVPFGLEATRLAVVAACEAAGARGEARLRSAANGRPFLTDGGHLILDLDLGRIDEPEALAAGLSKVPGVVEHGLFIGLASGAILAGENGLVELGRL
jgi:ribose 5-phosphate isomerase A